MGGGVGARAHDVEEHGRELQVDRAEARAEAAGEEEDARHRRRAAHRRRARAVLPLEQRHAQHGRAADERRLDRRVEREVTRAVGLDDGKPRARRPAREALVQRPRPPSR